MAVIAQLKDGAVVKKFLVDKTPVKIGRDDNCDIVIDDRVVSQTHAEIQIVKLSDKKNDYKFYIKDLGSTNGTFVNEKSIEQQQLFDGDLIRLGWTTFKFSEKNDPADDKTLKIHKSWIPGVYYTKE
jgi:pSer/pThr/pTyr-binding forkhead associated (FHA) protein